MTGDGSTSTRTAILDAAERILRDEGHARVTSRHVGTVAGLKSQLVHYHFRTMEELFLAVFTRIEERHLARIVAATAEAAPLSALWTLAIDSTAPRLTKEFIAMASHRPKLRQEIARSAERTRDIVRAAIDRALERSGVEDAPPAIALAVLMDGAARVIHSDRAMGSAAGHTETIDYIARQIGRLER